MAIDYGNVVYVHNDRGPQFDLNRDRIIEMRVLNRILKNYVDPNEKDKAWDPKDEPIVI